MEPFPRNLVARNGRVFTIDFARPADLDEVVQFLRQHFFSTSPNCYLVNRSNGPIEDGGLHNYLSGCVKDPPVSLTVRDSDGRLAAVRLNELEEPGALHHEALTPPANEKPRLIMSLLGDLEEGIDLFTTFSTKKILALAMMAVDKSYGQLGLATTLVSLSLDLAKANGAGAVKVCAVSQHAARVAAKNGLETIRTIDYATYEFNGEKPLAQLTDLLAEHSVAVLMARRL
ncbi:hypothetical protein DAPPUDRAFT_249096 [Daphnia pulex]|uniref:N-acetyltransferase domain-containing protein n=1 Tax=Daphnia pulex TaxID=6669 RepID=E9GVU7_DAPPU|nr:hypothetical protein DAPPUDRAFT_249096 [Daphnia pulex]|eukprot:EFX76241.1 hypothetical protein DAPPUDRAFT_249096 [Daphnia pulex]